MSEQKGQTTIVHLSHITYDQYHCNSHYVVFLCFFLYHNFILGCFLVFSFFHCFSTFFAFVPTRIKFHAKTKQIMTTQPLTKNSQCMSSVYNVLEVLKLFVGCHSHLLTHTHMHHTHFLVFTGLTFSLCIGKMFCRFSQGCKTTEG